MQKRRFITHLGVGQKTCHFNDPDHPKKLFLNRPWKVLFHSIYYMLHNVDPYPSPRLAFFPRFPPGAFRSHAAFRRYGPYPWHWPWGSLAAHPSSPQTIPLVKYFEFGLKKESFKWIWGCIQMDLVYRPRNQTKKMVAKQSTCRDPSSFNKVAKSQKTGSRRGWMREDLHQTLLMAAGAHIMLYMPMATEYDNFWLWRRTTCSLW